jgi:hypothetical protein
MHFPKTLLLNQSMISPGIVPYYDPPSPSLESDPPGDLEGIFIFPQLFPQGIWVFHPSPPYFSAMAWLIT